MTIYSSHSKEEPINHLFCAVNVVVEIWPSNFTVILLEMFHFNNILLGIFIFVIVHWHFYLFLFIYRYNKLFCCWVLYFWINLLFFRDCIEWHFDCFLLNSLCVFSIWCAPYFLLLPVLTLMLMCFGNLFSYFLLLSSENLNNYLI